MSAPTLAAEVSGSGPRLVLVHGFTQTGRSWSKVAADLAPHHTVVAVDLPGHGGSSSVSADLVDAARLLGDVGGRASYVGYSLGGRLAIHLALLQPALVDRLVVVGASGGIDDANERSQRRAADEALARGIEADGVEPFLDRWLAQPMFAGLPTDEISGRGRADRLGNTAAGLASSLRLAGTGTQQPLWDRLGALDMPVLVAAGALDAKFLALGERLVDSIGPSATLVSIPGAGHAAHLEAPAQFVGLLRSWLADHPVGA